MRVLDVSPVREMSMRGPGVDRDNHGAGGSGENVRDCGNGAVTRLAGDERLEELSRLKDRDGYLYTPADLLACLACRELSPRLLDFEKALLVVKEHDYARPPDRPMLLQLASMYVREAEGTANKASVRERAAAPGHGQEAAAVARSAAEARGETEGGEAGCRGRHVTAEDVLLNCRNDVIGLRASLARRGSDDDGAALATHLREIVGLQVALIREQQEQLHEKDGELKAVRRDKEQVRIHIASVYEIKLACQLLYSRRGFPYIP